jgi:hypothetical protein
MSSYSTTTQINTTLSSYLTNATASSTYQTIANMSNYSTTTQMNSAISSALTPYLTTTTASSTYQSIANLTNKTLDAQLRTAIVEAGTIENFLSLKRVGTGSNLGPKITFVANSTASDYTTNICEMHFQTLTASSSSLMFRLSNQTNTALVDVLQLRNSSGTISITSMGSISCSIAPTTTSHLTNKSYVDGAISTALSSYSNTTQMNSAISSALVPYLMLNGNGGINIPSGTITNAPTNANDIVNKNYCDTQITSISSNSLYFAPKVKCISPSTVNMQATITNATANYYEYTLSYTNVSGKENANLIYLDKIINRKDVIFSTTANKKLCGYFAFEIVDSSGNSIVLKNIISGFCDGVCNIGNDFENAFTNTYPYNGTIDANKMVFLMSYEQLTSSTGNYYCTTTSGLQTVPVNTTTTNQGANTIYFSTIGYWSNNSRMSFQQILINPANGIAFQQSAIDMDSSFMPSLGTYVSGGINSLSSFRPCLIIPTNVGAHKLRLYYNIPSSLYNSVSTTSFKNSISII